MPDREGLFAIAGREEHPRVGAATTGHRVPGRPQREDVAYNPNLARAVDFVLH